MSRLALTVLGFVFVLGLGLISAQRIRYDNYQVYEVIPQSEEQVNILRELDGNNDSIRFLEGVGKPGVRVYVVVAPHKQPDFTHMLSSEGIQYKSVETNLQRKLDEENPNPNSRATRTYDWTRYHTLEETYTWLDTLAANFPVVEKIRAGKTYEGRDILGVKVSYGPLRKAIFLEAGIHAREWISPAVVTYILNEMLTSKDPQVRALAEGYDWYFVPHANPDGYVYTHKRDRLWRKTRSRQGSCYGADPNRNWDFHWNTVGASNQPCSETYAGKSAFSEIETKTFSDYLASVKDNVKLYLSFHSYSQLLLFPYGHTKSHAHNHNDLQRIGDITTKALAKRYRTQFKAGNIYDIIYPSAGGSIDWVHTVLDIPLSFCYELRPTASSWNGFVLPANQIVPSGKETLDSIIAMVNEAKRLRYFN